MITAIITTVLAFVGLLFNREKLKNESKKKDEELNAFKQIQEAIDAKQKQEKLKQIADSDGDKYTKLMQRYQEGLLSRKPPSDKSDL